MNQATDHLLKMFERMKEENIDLLQSVTRLQLRFFQVTPAGEVDITAEHRERIVRAIDQLEQAITYLKSHG